MRIVGISETINYFISLSRGSTKLQINKQNKTRQKFYTYRVNRILIKLFRASNTDMIKGCRDVFDVKLPSVQPMQRFDVFMTRLERYHYVNLC